MAFFQGVSWFGILMKLYLRNHFYVKTKQFLRKTALRCIPLLPPYGLQPARLLCPWDSLSKRTGVGCHFRLQGIFPTQESNLGLLHCRQILYWLSYEESPQSASISHSVVSNSVTPWSVHGILRARILEWVAIPFSRGSSYPGIELSLLHCRQILYHLSYQGNPSV